MKEHNVCGVILQYLASKKSDKKLIVPLIYTNLGLKDENDCE